MLGLTLLTSFRRSEPWARATFDTGLVPRATLPAMGLLQVSDPLRFGRNRPIPAWVSDRIEEVTEAYLPSGQAHDLADPLVVLERGNGRREILAFTHRHVAGVDDPIREMPWAHPVP